MLIYKYRCKCVRVWMYTCSLPLSIKRAVNSNRNQQTYPDCGFLNTICHFREPGFLGRVPDSLYENTANCKQTRNYCKEMALSFPLQYSCLGNSMDRGVWWATLGGVTKSRTWLNMTKLSLHKLILVNSKHKNIYSNFILELLPFGEAGQTPFWSRG